MTLLIALLIASVVSSILVVAAGILSSRSTGPEEFVETYYALDADELPADGMPQVE